MSMTNPDFRALCVELVELSAPTNSIPQLGERLQKLSELANRARAAVAQPEPVAPTDEEIAQFVAEWWENMQGFAPHGDKTVYTVFEFVAREHFADFTRDVLARWGTPANTINQED